MPKCKKTIFVCGNGGSAATAEHFSNDLFSKGKKVICLSSNMSIMTMIANDYGYKYVFSRQLEVLAEKGDLLITISCSGTSENILEAKNVAEELGMEVYSFPAFTEDRDYASLENKHLELAHKIAAKE